ncbi:MAG TPA: M14 family metallopeptidase, partial [Chitinophagaceae bacterium]|nr:M14 family metallopeptidase [Chitinophagaceae bacterium]
NRLSFYHQWKPNIFTDHHEMGSGSSFFFQPGVPSRANPNTPKLNQELTGKIGNFHAKYLDSIGSLYFTKEGYDDFYYGKGSTYPDINGGIGILFEQASSRGHAQETENGLLTFPFTIRNQFTTTLSTLAAAKSLRKELLTYQKNFYTDVQKEATAATIRGYVFGDGGDKSRNYQFLNILLRHQIEVYEVKTPITTEGKTFAAGSSFIVPASQLQYKVIKAIFEKTLEYKDSLFYDVTAWTFPLAFNLPYATMNSATSAFQGPRVTTAVKPAGSINGGASEYAYLFSWEDYYAPKLLYQLQQKGLITKVATQKLEANTTEGAKKFEYGSILINVKGQTKTPQEVYNIINESVGGSGVVVYSVPSGLSTGGIDLGSASFNFVKQPKVMMFGGTGTSATDVGEIWHLLDQKFNMPVSIVDVDRFNAIAVDKYNVVIMPSGTYTNLDKSAQDKLRAWISGGGTLIATEDAVRWLASNAFTKVLFKSTDNDKRDTTLALPYFLRSDETRAKEMAGSIFEAKIDITHPLCYGYKQTTVSIFKSNNLFMDGNNNPYDSPVMYTANPLQSGYLFRGYKEAVKNSAAINIDVVGRGKIISMIDNLNFRAFWYGTSKMFMNAIYFGDIIRLQ